MKIRTTSDLLNALTDYTDTMHLFGLINQSENSTRTWLQEYTNHASYLDSLYLGRFFGNIEIDKDLQIDIDNATVLQSVVTYFKNVMESFDEIERIWQAITKDYNPIWNVDGTEIETYSSNDTHVYDDVTNTDTQTGSIVDNNVKNGSQNTTRKGTDSVDNNGSDTTTVKQGTAISGDLLTTEEDTNTLGTTQSTTYNTIVTTDYNGLTENATKTYNDLKNVNVKSGAENDNKKYEKTLIRQGNIGVTKSSDLVQSEIELRKNHFWTYVYTTWVKWFTTERWDVE